jgi:hypothetical protein
MVIATSFDSVQFRDSFKKFFHTPPGTEQTASGQTLPNAMNMAFNAVLEVMVRRIMMEREHEREYVNMGNIWCHF